MLPFKFDTVERKGETSMEYRLLDRSLVAISLWVATEFEEYCLANPEACEFRCKTILRNPWFSSSLNFMKLLFQNTRSILNLPGSEVRTSSMSTPFSKKAGLGSKKQMRRWFSLPGPKSNSRFVAIFG